MGAAATLTADLSREPATTHRRRVAVLFVDVSGFTQLVETAPPEMVYQVIRPLMDELVLRVAANGGRVQQVLGDGFMAVFGLAGEAGDATGDAVAAALSAGLTLLEVSGDRFPPVHVGVECGEVLITPSWEPAGFGVWGRPVNLAKRLCDLAGPGELRIGPAAFRERGHRVASGTAVCARLKGIKGEVLAYRVTR
jgi:class 3 adenylate cyclase